MLPSSWTWPGTPPSSVLEDIKLIEDGVMRLDCSLEGGENDVVGELSERAVRTAIAVNSYIFALSANTLVGVFDGEKVG